MNKDRFYKGICFWLTLFTVIVAIVASYEQPVRRYKQTAKKMDVVQIYQTKDMNAEILENRKENQKIIIEEVIGKVIDNEGHGKILDPSNYDYDYISYKYVDNAKAGDIILSYMIYNTENDYIDDIEQRVDYIIKRGVN